MPILDIEIVGNETGEKGLADKLAAAAGRVFGSPAGQTWVRLRHLPESNYGESGGGPPEGVRPVFVTVLKAHWPDPAEMPGEIRRLTDEMARVCRRPAENIHVLYLPAAAGRIAFGGKLVE